VLHPQVHPENDLAIASSQVWNLPRDYSFERSHACLKLNQGYFRGCLPSHPDVNLRSTWPNRSDDLSPISIRAPENFKEEAPSHCAVPYGQLTKKKSAPPTRLGHPLPRFSNLQTTAARSPRRRGAPTRRAVAARRARRHRHRRASWVPRRPPPRRRGRLRRRTRARAAAAAPAAHARRGGS